jgi:hypothetical protein
MALARVELLSSATRQVVQTCRQEQDVYCDVHKKYRNSDGSCNNLVNPHWGRGFTCFTRLLAPAYSDGLSAPRRSVAGGALPNARMISAVMHRDLNYPATYTHMAMQYGQFFAHDIAFTPSSRTSKSHSFVLQGDLVVLVTPTAPFAARSFTRTNSIAFSRYFVKRMIGIIE